MLIGDRAKYAGLLMGVAFTAFLVTFAAAYFAGFMTRSYALIRENPAADIWVMDPAVTTVDRTINMPDSALEQVRSVTGVGSAAPLALGRVNARFANGRFQEFQVIGVDDATLQGAPLLEDGSELTGLHGPNAAIVDAGGTEGKLETPSLAHDQWPYDGAHLDAPTRELRAGDELLADGRRIEVIGRSNSLPRFPPRPLLYTTYSNAAQILPRERHLLTFVLVSARGGANLQQLARRIRQETGLRARTAPDFVKDTVIWNLLNSEDVGDMGAMIILAMTVGFGATGILLYMFTYENLKHYAVLKSMGASNRTLKRMLGVQTCMCVSIGTGLGLGLCAIASEVVSHWGFPFRLMWFAPLLGIGGVMIVSLTAALISIRPVLRFDPGIVFAGR
jgi:putative ABC transport system permease protein